MQFRYEAWWDKKKEDHHNILQRLDPPTQEHTVKKEEEEDLGPQAMWLLCTKRKRGASLHNLYMEREKRSREKRAYSTLIQGTSDCTMISEKRSSWRIHPHMQLLYGKIQEKANTKIWNKKFVQKIWQRWEFIQKFRRKEIWKIVFFDEKIVKKIGRRKGQEFVPPTGKL